MVKTIIMKPSD